jgi:hypothetical protein
MINEEHRLRLSLGWPQLENPFEPTGSGTEVFEPRLVRLRLRLGCWSLGLGSGSRLRLLSLKNSHEILHLTVKS